MKFRRRVWILRHLKKALIPTKDLINLYKALILPVLDYTSVTYHSMLGVTRISEIEKLQKLALKIIFGVTGVTYESLLERADIETVACRRQRLVDGFIKRAVVHPEFKEWFPSKRFSGYNLREEKIYMEKRTRTSRLYNSPLYYFRRRLNAI